MSNVKTLAFYLPQFHTIPENDEWWGAGFTEWVNVRRATPQFDGHDHPRVAQALGEYDLTDPSVGTRQSELARANGVDAFCMYFYWFDGQRLLEKPIDSWRERTDLLPYCLSWANESWTRRWDGKDSEVLAAQNYRPGFARGLFADLLPHFQAPHYLRHQGAPVLVIHRSDLIPDPRSFAEEMRAMASEAGLGGVYLVASETKHGLSSEDFGFDAVAEFPPVGSNTLGSAQLTPVPGLAKDFRGRLLSYDKLATTYENRKAPSFVRHRGVMPGWDNTARRGAKATIYVGSSPRRYAQWLGRARAAEQSERGSDGLVFINAWNEWAEGAYLEPDSTHGDAYLTATRPGAAVTGAPTTLRRGRPGLPHARSLVLVTATTVLKYVRRITFAARRASRAFNVPGSA